MLAVGTAKTPKNLRTAPQSADQTWDGLNAALKRSVDLKKPIRVLRGFKGKSAFAPEEGYRYDGLYIATKASTLDLENTDYGADERALQPGLARRRRIGIQGVPYRARPTPWPGEVFCVVLNRLAWVLTC